jgi:hypothetical protein
MASSSASALRVSDAERDAVVEELCRHASAGRLDADELEDRIDVALGAKVRSELEGLRDDLPRRPEVETGLDGHVRAFVLVNAGLAVLWALTGFGYFWPVWPFLGWGVGVVVHAACVSGRDREWDKATATTPGRRRTASSSSC